MDLNLLVVLDSLLRTKSTTKTASALGRSQSAVSHSLKKLREALEDPILVREGIHMLLTPRAEMLQEPLQLWLQQGSELIFHEPSFDPAVAQNQFRIAASDYVLSSFLDSFVRSVSEEAPHVNVHCVPPVPGQLAHQQLASGEVDLVMWVSNIPEQLRAKKLFKDQFVAMVAKGHPHNKPTFDTKSYAQHNHLLTSPLGTKGVERSSYLSRTLEEQGLSRRIAFTVPHFTLGPRLLHNTELVLTLPKRIAETLLDPEKHRLIPLEFDTPTIEVSMVWHEKRHRESSHRWLRKQVQNAIDAQQRE
ncbi:MAG: LysR family transcriptional regulator [Myxococcota bacterium]|nr:LysR family transcriptional regulator [Myxococcota bacterium]